LQNDVAGPVLVKVLNMGNADRIKVPIDADLFREAFGRDINYQDFATHDTYLDKETGNILWLWENDEDAMLDVGVPEHDNAALRRRIEASPNRYLKLPGRTHGEHHDVLREYLDSDWTDNVVERERVKSVYVGSIGKWMKTVDDEATVNAFREFRESRLLALGAEFLRENGIEPKWT